MSGYVWCQSAGAGNRIRAKAVFSDNKQAGEGAGVLYESLPHQAQATGKRCSWAIVSTLGLADDRCHMNRSHDSTHPPLGSVGPRCRNSGSQ